MDRQIGAIKDGRERKEARGPRVSSPAYPGTQAVLRAVSLLKAFTPAHPQRGLADLARELGLHKTTAFRLLSALQSEGLVERDGDGQGYRLGPELLVLGTNARGGRDLRGASHEEMEALAEHTRETVTLEVLTGGQVLILDEAMGGHMVGANPSVGTRWPAHATSTGKVLLADLSPEERALALTPPLAAPTARTITDLRVLERELLRVRERGYAVSAEELEVGFVAVGAAVRRADGVAVGAVSVGGPRTRFGVERVAALARQLSSAAASISARLGYRPTAAGSPLGRRRRRQGRPRRG